MTDYGRGAGSEPWYPDDPSHGDQNWPEGYDPHGRHQAPQAGAGAWDAYGGQGPEGQPPAGYQNPSYPDPSYQNPGYQDPSYQDPSYQGQGQGGWDPNGPSQPADPYGQGQGGGERQGYQQGYQQGGYDTGGYPQGSYDQGSQGGQGLQGGAGVHGGNSPQGNGGYGAGPYEEGGRRGDAGYGGSYGGNSYETGGYASGEYDTGGYQTGGYQTGGYDTGGYQTGGYDTGGYQAAGYDTGARGGYGDPGAAHSDLSPPGGGQRLPGDYPGEPQGATQAMDAVRVPHARAGEPEPGPDPETGWDPGPDQGESDFFRRDDDEDDRDDDRDGDGRRGDGRSGRRKGCGCLLLAAVVIGGIGGVGWYGYQFYQDRFGPAPDYEGEGQGEVEVEIPAGAVLSQMGNILKEADVVKSHDAFVEAAEAAEAQIQPGVYTLRQQMSAEAAVAALTDPSALNVLTIPEGRRATDIYAMIDERLELEEGTTEEVAESGTIGLPEWAEGDPEGFLFPARYDVGGETTPEDLLTQMVARAEAEFEGISLETAAEQLDRTPREVLTIASLIQAEAQEDEEFGKVSRVIYNRLEIDMKLQFDSTVNYALGRSTLDVTLDDIEVDSPYNTYEEYGLPPGPIDNPGHQALEAALNPTEGDWLFFVTVEPGDTRFTADDEEHELNVEDFNEAQRRAREEADE
ncbi:endolytic transglycosylase MltG [Streptomyces sp. NBRC 109706]|uniref:endolytic transglycosylase MltG n=1 Tax=Streptomyces sp. NBRC 109706 TaxID=1550035 RepID=UPI00078515A1|nr:endolytic transglycosylase MltG [Streptomyces sp. NBRC 109706]